MKRGPGRREVLVVFESRYGQSRRIAERVAALAEERGYQARRRDAVGTLSLSSILDSSDFVVVVAPVYDRKHARNITELVRAHRDALNERPLALISVSLAAGLGKTGLPELPRVSSPNPLSNAIRGIPGWASNRHIPRARADRLDRRRKTGTDNAGP